MSHNFSLVSRPFLLTFQWSRLFNVACKALQKLGEGPGHEASTACACTCVCTFISGRERVYDQDKRLNELTELQDDVQGH